MISILLNFDRIAWEDKIWQSVLKRNFLKETGFSIYNQEWNAAADFLCVLGYGANNKTLTCVCVVYGEALLSCALRQRLLSATPAQAALTLRNHPT